jgi:hypothetical protein
MKTRYDLAIENAREAIEELRLAAYEQGYKDAVANREQRAPVSKAPTRDEIVEQAMADVVLITHRGTDVSQIGASEGNDTYRTHTYVVEFVVNKDKRAVTALVRRGRYFTAGKVEHVGVAKCDPSDCFNVHLGKAIALRRALGLDVPSEYLNAPQPTEVRVGDIIFAMKKFRKVVATDGEVDVRKNPPTCNVNSPMVSENCDRIIDDSREAVRND